MRVQINIMLVSVSLILLSTFAVAETFEQQFVRTIHEFHLARYGMKDAGTLFGRALDNALNKDLEVSALRDAKQKLDVATDVYRKTSTTLNDFITKNTEKLKGNTVAEWARKELKSYDDERLSTLVKVTTELVNSIREVEFTVFANEDWASSSLAVSEKDIFVIKHDGQWTVSPAYSATNAEGYICDAKSSYNVLAGAPLGALIYRVRGTGNTNPMALIDGKGFSSGKGRLEFMINDSDRRNNGGQLNLKVIVFDSEKVKALTEIK